MPVFLKMVKKLGLAAQEVAISVLQIQILFFTGSNGIILGTFAVGVLLVVLTVPFK